MEENLIPFSPIIMEEKEHEDSILYFALCILQNMRILNFEIKDVIYDIKLINQKSTFNQFYFKLISNYSEKKFAIVIDEKGDILFGILLWDKENTTS